LKIIGSFFQRFEKALCRALQTLRDMSENIFGIIQRAVSSRMECIECRLKFTVNILNSRHKVYLGAYVDKFISIIITRKYFAACAFTATCKLADVIANALSLLQCYYPDCDKHKRYINYGKNTRNQEK